MSCILHVIYININVCFSLGKCDDLTTEGQNNKDEVTAIDEKVNSLMNGKFLLPQTKARLLHK